MSETSDNATPPESGTDVNTDTSPGPDAVEPRRQVLRAALGAGLGLTLGTPLYAAQAPDKMRPQPGDWVVFRFGDRAGQIITPGDVPEGAELLQAAAMDPASEIVRDGSRLNGFNLVRVSPDAFDDKTKPFAVEDIVAYSSICTHQGCDLTQWLPESRTFKCYCHYSEFDASQFGAPQHGPAKRRLALLPLTLADGALQVAAPFNGRVGFKK